MCGRYVLAANLATIQTQFDVIEAIDFAPRYNIAPTQLAPVIINETPRALSMLRWGLIPSWAKDESMGSKMINARSETVEEKPSFRTAFKRRRCIVPASGFYEWQTRSDGKTPIFIQPTDDELWALAGLWETWKDADGAEVRTYTILTTEANDFMKQFHERMPVMLRHDDYEQWLEPGDVPADVLRPLLRPYDPDAMRAHEVSKMVNRPAVDSPDCIEPIAS